MWTRLPQKYVYMALPRSVRHVVLSSTLLAIVLMTVASTTTLSATLLGKGQSLRDSFRSDTSSSLWFILHPLLAIAGTVSLPVPAVLLRKYKGYWSKKIHAYFFIAGVALTIASLYVIYVNKEAKGKWHIQSYHAIAGAVLVLGYIAFCVIGVLALDPDYACIPSEDLKSTLKWVHKSGGRVLLVAGYWVCFSGWYKFYQGSDLTTGFLVALMASFLTYVDPIVAAFGVGKKVE